MNDSSPRLPAPHPAAFRGPRLAPPAPGQASGGPRRREIALAAAVAGLLVPGISPAQQRAELVADLDPLVTLPGAFALTPDDLEERFEQGDWSRNPYFTWLETDKTRAIFQRKRLPNLSVELALLGGSLPAEEVVVDFEDGKLLGITVSLFNRGDGGAITGDEFQRRYAEMGRHLGEQLAARPVRKEARPTQGMLTAGWVWISSAGKAVLEHNPEAPGNAEFLRLRLARRDAGGVYEAATQDRAGAAVRLSQLPQRLRRGPEGEVFIDGIPMVDQGAKGYCVVASVQRLFEYYGIPADMHQLAQIAKADPESGTSILEINRELGAIDHLFKTRFQCLAVRHQSGLVQLVDNQYVGKAVPERDFHRLVRKSIDEGIPVLWSLEVGRYPEDPPLTMQSGGGHMRMIIGYHDAANRLIFTDSWGAGHEYKTMDADHAYQATSGIFLLKPTLR